MHTRVTQHDSYEFKLYFHTKNYTVDYCKKEYLGWEHSPQTGFSCSLRGKRRICRNNANR